MSKSDILRQLDVSRETSDRLEIYAELLQKWNPKINLVSKSSIDDLWGRHIMDSAQVFDLAPNNKTHWADLGAGGGFPGLVVAILAAEKASTLKTTLVESDVRKSTFLQTVVRETGLNTTVCIDRIERLPPLNADIVSARALAPLKTLLSYAERHLAQDGTAIFPKGANHQNELTESLEHWRFSVHKHPSVTDPDSVILSIGDIARV